MTEALVAFAASVAAYVGGAVAFIVLQRRIAAGIPVEWRSIPSLSDRLEKVAEPVNVGAMLRNAVVNGWRWLAAVFAAALFFRAIGAGVWFLVLWAFAIAILMTGGEIDRTRHEVQALREANPGLPRTKRNIVERIGRWIARVFMWAGFLAAPCSLAAALLPA